ncbi:MAG: DNA polymerase III subunit gamma/tau [Patescibacteria group bacterium]
MSTTLYRKYRPQTFADVVGQRHIVTTLTNALRLGRVGQAYLLTGPRGTGKTTLARLFAKAVNCSDRKKNDAEPCNRCKHCLLMAEGRSFDVIEIDAASHTGVDNIRELRETVNLPPTLGSHKVYIIDEVHMLSIGAWGALLKTLEEPPAHVIFILATTALHKVPDTIVSRCQRFDLSRFPVRLIVEKLEKIAKSEKLKIEHGALEMIALTAEGGMRDAESLLMQIASLEASPITEDTIIEVLGTTKKENIVTLLRLIGGNELYPSLSFVRKLVSDGVDLAIFCGVLLHYLRDLLLVSADPKNGPGELENLTEEQKTTLSEFAAIFTPADIVRMLEYFQIAQAGSKTSVIPELPLEIAIVKILSANLPTGQAGSSQPPKNNTPPEEKAPETIAAEQAPAPLAAETKSPKKDYSKTPTKTKPESPISTLNKNLPRSFDSESNGTGAATETTSETENTTHPIIDLGIVREKWATILHTAKQLNASLTLALSTARPLTAHDSTIVIAVKYPFHKERLDENANRLTLATAFDSILGSKIKLSIVLEEAPEPKDQKASAADEAVLSPLVSQAMDLLGGKLIKEA